MPTVLKTPEKPVGTYDNFSVSYMMGREVLEFVVKDSKIADRKFIIRLGLSDDIDTKATLLQEISGKVAKDHDTVVDLYIGSEERFKDIIKATESDPKIALMKLVGIMMHDIEVLLKDYKRANLAQEVAMEFLSGLHAKMEQA